MTIGDPTPIITTYADGRVEVDYPKTKCYEVKIDHYIHAKSGEQASEKFIALIANKTVQELKDLALYPSAYERECDDLK